MSTQTENAPQSGTEDWQNFGAFRSRIVHRERIAADTELLTLERPDDFEFKVGQTIDLALDRVGHREHKQTYALTGLPHQRRLEVIVKSGQFGEDKDGLNAELVGDTQVNDRVLFDSPSDGLANKGPGVWIVEGIGLSMAVAFIRNADAERSIDGHRMFVVNRKADDVFLQSELTRLLGRAVVFTLTEETKRDYESGTVDRRWLESRIDCFDQPFYVCGSRAFVDNVSNDLCDLRVSAENLNAIGW